MGIEKKSVDDQEIPEYINWTSLCMKQKCFRYYKEFYEEVDGIAMDNPL